LQLDHRVLDRHRPPVDADVPDADVVIATWWETAEWVDALSAKKGAKVYFIQHHEVVMGLSVDRVQKTYNLPLHKIVVANWLKDVMENQYRDPVVDLVPNAVNHEHFFASPRGKQSRPTIGFLYNATYFKGLDVTLAAVRELKRRIPDLRAICFGEWPPSANSPLEDWIEFELAPHQNRIREIYSRCDVWLTASRSEGFNLPAMEAMACRAPIVSTRTGWPAEAIVNNGNGVLVEVDDINGLVDGAIWILERSDREWRVLSDSAFKTVATTSWESSALLFETALNHACGRAIAK